MRRIIGRYVIRFTSVNGEESMLYYQTPGYTPHRKALIVCAHKLLERKAKAGQIPPNPVLKEIWQITRNRNQMLKTVL